eukprot:TRINITY_DN1941_c0_g2_i1.p1 TRINITY_DN1941_c0_g2~~TRINITY_DN1941_c0_g2_i1.p1  ORF type:complete len:226 (-),score=21.85 TRINITY_DN1941_c0_g2_i1:92-769(-)
MSSSSIVIYGDMMSQPARAVYWFCLLNDIKNEFKLVSITKLEHRSEEFGKINPLKKLPVIVDNGQVIIESHAILRYLKCKYNTPDHWYPSNLNERVKIDQYLDWHHLGFRAFASSYFQAKYLFPKFGKTTSEARVNALKRETEVALKALNDVFMGSTPYINSDKVSIADLSCYCELKQLETVHFDLSPYPKILEWRKRIESLPYYDKVHVVFNKVLASENQKSKL